MTRGFITIATGDRYYYKLAANLLLSYRLNTKNPLPFAVIAEEENEYTAMFDDVIITSEASRSFMDKLLLLKLCPYDETIFFDADILAYRDLNEYWKVFNEKSTDFSSIGANFELHEHGAWYEIEDIQEYGSMISYKTRVHMGVCFIRRSDKLIKLLNDCMDIISNYDKLDFHEWTSSKDEAVLGVAMPMNNMRAEPEVPEMMAALPCLTSIDASMLRGKLSYTTKWGWNIQENGLLVHFGTIQTHQPMYLYEAMCVRYLIRCKKRKPLFIEELFYEYGIAKCYAKIAYLAYRIRRKIRNLIKNK